MIVNVQNELDKVNSKDTNFPVDIKMIKKYSNKIFKYSNNPSIDLFV